MLNQHHRIQILALFCYSYQLKWYQMYYLFGRSMRCTIYLAIANWEEIEAKMQGKADQGVKGIVVSRTLLRLCYYSAKQCAARP